MLNMNKFRKSLINEFNELNIGELEEIETLTNEEIQDLINKIRKLFEKYPNGIESNKFMEELEQTINCTLNRNED
jgi:uncharacterized protein YutE (UPF0331/DUF86 family)